MFSDTKELNLAAVSCIIDIIDNGFIKALDTNRNSSISLNFKNTTINLIKSVRLHFVFCIVFEK